MRINHNIAALNTYNQLAKNTESANSSLAKLSSGLQINSASDDPAGLSISEKMRSQIRGLERATENAQDGISMIQTAEGALKETTEILQRMRELSVQASSDTATASDRTTIQDELDQLAQEITRIADTTKFNGQTLMGSMSQFSGSFLIGSDAGQSLAVSMNAMDTVTLGVGANATSDAAVTEVAFVSGNGNEFSAGGVDLTGYTQSLNLNIKIKMVSAGDGAGAKAVATVTINGVTRSVTADDDSAASPSFTLTSATFGDIFESGQQVVITGANTPDAGDEVNISISGEQNGITALSVSDNTLAGMAITAIDAAILAGSSQRSKLGAYQNRLEHTINNLNTASENLTSAESRIRDVDMASEMVEYSKMNILTQAAQAMLAQANQQPQNILRLLQ
jgi:flagellin